MMKDGKYSALHMAAWWLVIIGGINWGLIGALDFNLIYAIFGSIEWLESLIYILVGLSSLVGLAGMMQMMKK